MPFRVELVRRAEIEPLRDIFDDSLLRRSSPKTAKSPRRCKAAVAAGAASAAITPSTDSSMPYGGKIPRARRAVRSNSRTNSAYVWQQRDGNGEIDYVVDMYYLRARDRFGSARSADRRPGVSVRRPSKSKGVLSAAICWILSASSSSSIERSALKVASFQCWTSVRATAASPTARSPRFRSFCVFLHRCDPQIIVSL